eukprot:m.87706 g.87706  ORF g.87706 m.87706 type:complete len:139 (-) comp14918_c0_seq1:624-1040(-)
MADCKAEQEDEVEALQSIFPDEFESVSEDPCCFRLPVKSTDIKVLEDEDNDLVASFDLEVTFTDWWNGTQQSLRGCCCCCGVRSPKVVSKCYKWLPCSFNGELLRLDSQNAGTKCFCMLKHLGPCRNIPGNSTRVSVC